MRKYKGKTVYKGIAVGPSVVVKKSGDLVRRSRIADAEAEIARLSEAVKTSQAQLQTLHERAIKEVGEAGVAIFEAHQMMLRDRDYLDAIHNIIRTDMVNAAYAVSVTGNRFSEMFANMDDEFMKARAADVKDVSNRLIRCLSGSREAAFYLEQPSVLVADDLSPSETVQMDKSRILAVVTVHGSANSHTAILMRMMNIPAMIGVPLDLEELNDGTPVVVDGFQSEVIFEPTGEERDRAERKLKEEKEKRELLHTLKGKENRTPDGRTIAVYANIGSVADVADALENDAGGIGLFRSEFLYLGRSDFPSEEEQFSAYRQVLCNMAGKKVVVRTLDVGGDKQADYFNFEKEENPALGCRAIRFCLSRPDVFKTQLRALLRAAVYGDLAVMYPMITSVEELSRIQAIVEESCRELEEKGISYRKPEQGIMIETPAAVMISDDLAQVVDFLSIGTNDLTQYALAVDRRNGKLDAFFNPHHKAILRMIKIVADNAHAAGKRVGICGELGADTELTGEFLKMGIDELSVAPSMILKVRHCVRETGTKE